MKKWEIKKMVDVCDIGAGNSAPQKKEFFHNGIYPFFRTSDIGRIRFGLVGDSADKLNDIGIAKLHLHKKGTLLFPKSGASTFLNHRVLMNTDGYVSSHLATIKAKNNVLDERFLLYYSSTIDSRNLMQDQNYPSLRLSDIEDINIPIPPILEQQRIVAILDEAFTAINRAKENAERNLQNAREIFESQLQILFSCDACDEWKKMTLRQVATHFGRGKSKHRPRNDKALYGGRYPFIQTGDIKNSNHMITDHYQTYNEVGLAQSKLWPKGTVCITIAANIAETGILGFDACFPDSVIGLVVNEQIADAGFVEYMLQSYRTALQAKGKGAAQDNINLATFENELFSIPPLFEQRLIAAKLDTLYAETRILGKIYQQKLDELEELKISILQKAFSGELSGAN